MAHARLVGQEMPAVAKVVTHMDWIGLAGRCLMWDRDMCASPMRLTDDDVHRAMEELICFGGELTQKLLGYRPFGFARR